MSLPQFEPLLRLGIFVGVFAAMALWELRRPWRPLTHGRQKRWPNNLGLVALNTFALRWFFPWTAVEFAQHVEQAHEGVLTALAVPFPLAWVLSVVLLDLVIYAQHVVFHRAPLLWRLHRMHHTDLDLDVTSGTRFHTLEILLSMVIKCGFIRLLGAPASAVLAFELLLNATAMFNHSNVAMPASWDRWLRRWVVTPDFHRIHHSIRGEETNSNYGFNLPWWDRLFGTYRATPEGGREAAITLGLPTFRESEDLRLDRLLVQPWR